MKNIILPLLIILSLNLFAGNNNVPSPPLIIHSEYLETYPQKQLDELYRGKNLPKSLVPVRYDVEIHKILYYTIDYRGDRVQASGLFFIPKDLQNPPLISYQHGTEIKKESRNANLKGEKLIPIALAANGYAVAMPDYVGMGDGEGFHPYLHATTQATATVDFIRACKAYSEENGTPLSDMLFLAGYSQGGHATMATHKYIEQKLGNEFTVTASAPMSGPYNLSGTLKRITNSGEHYDHLSLFAYLIVAYDMIYDLYDSPSELFQAPYDSIVPAMVNGQYSGKEIEAALPESYEKMLKPEVWHAIVNNPEHPFWKALKANDVFEWQPKAPVQLCYCKGDKTVSYKNSLTAYESFKENGATNIKLRRAHKKLGHVKCAYYSFLYSKLWFDSFRDNKRNHKGALGSRFLLSLSKPFFK